MELPSASLPEPLLLLGFSAGGQDGVGAQVDGEEAGAHTQTDVAQLLTDGGDIARAASQATVGLRDEEQLQTYLGPEEGADDVLWESLVGVELAQLLGRQHPVSDVRDQVEDHLALFEL